MRLHLSAPVGPASLDAQCKVGMSFFVVVIIISAVGETSLKLREEHRLRVFENRVLRRIFGLKRDEVTGGWRELHNEELHDLYSSPSIIRMVKSRRMRLAGNVARMLKLALTSPTSDGRSAGIVRSRIKATEFVFGLNACVVLVRVTSAAVTLSVPLVRL
jgi:hypothetical protein